MDQVIVDIPKEAEAWEPPVLRTEEETPRTESAADVFFMQYAVCILVLTALLILRLCDQNAYSGVIDTFRSQSDAPDLPWTDALLSLIAGLWS